MKNKDISVYDEFHYIYITIRETVRIIRWHLLTHRL